MIDIQSFYGYWQFWVSLFASISLLSIWHHIGRKKGDFGQVWLAISIIWWAISGAIDVIESKSLVSLSKDAFSAFRSICSLFNSLFILLALPWFRYTPSFLEKLVSSKQWGLIAFLPFIFSILPSVSKILGGREYGLLLEADVYYSLLTLSFLGCVLFVSFKQRRLTLLAYLSIACILITLIAQLFKLNNSYEQVLLFSSIFKSMLIMLFFALALSWVKELSEKLQIDQDKLSLKYIGIEKSKVIWEIGGVNYEVNRVALPAISSELLLQFASAKLGGDGWLTFKPKSQMIGNAEIKDYNEVKRLINYLLDGIFGKGNWSKNLHYLPFKEAFFIASENRDRKIKLNIPTNSIILTTH